MLDPTKNRLKRTNFSRLLNPLHRTNYNLLPTSSTEMVMLLDFGGLNAHMEGASINLELDCQTFHLLKDLLLEMIDDQYNTSDGSSEGWWIYRLHQTHMED